MEGAIVVVTRHVVQGSDAGTSFRRGRWVGHCLDASALKRRRDLVHHNGTISPCIADVGLGESQLMVQASLYRDTRRKTRLVHFLLYSAWCTYAVVVLRVAS